MTTTFEQLDLIAPLLVALEHAGISNPTDIQIRAIPPILENKDVLGQSETGTGKTLAYLLPILQKIDTHKREVQAMILTPTHELAIQVLRQIEALAKNSALEVTSTSLIGNVNIDRQVDKLKRKPHILVGSSGRILELIQKRRINMQTVKCIVLDEADRLLDENNIVTVKTILKSALRDAQLLLFSASLSQSTIRLASGLLKNPELIQVTQQIKIASDITHMYIATEQRDKFEVLRKLIGLLNPTRALIFINRGNDIDWTVDKLKFHQLDAAGLHGSSAKADRKKLMDDFRSGKLHLLVASDLAARGLDIKDVSHVINLDVPEDPQNYLHRVGRTGRAGQSGIAISIASPREIAFLEETEKAYKIEIVAQDMFKGALIPVRNSNSKSDSKGPSVSDKKLLTFSDKQRIAFTDKQRIAFTDKQRIAFTDKQRIAITDKQRIAFTDKQRLPFTEKKLLSLTEKKLLAVNEKKSFSAADNKGTYDQVSSGISPVDITDHRDTLLDNLDSLGTLDSLDKSSLPTPERPKAKVKVKTKAKTPTTARVKAKAKVKTKASGKRRPKPSQT